MSNGFTAKKVKLLQRMYGHEFFDEYNIASMRAQLCTFGLTADDLEVISCHGTSTKANDINESTMVNYQMKLLNRTVGHPLYSIWQKYLTGHAKGGAGAHMLNGLIQVLNCNIIPGNRNGDDFDPAFNKLEHMTLINESIYLPEDYLIKAVYLHSFGFGQANAQCILIHPHVFFQALNNKVYQSYRSKVMKRLQSINQHIQYWYTNEKNYVEIHDAPPYNDENMIQYILDVEARV